MSYHVKKAMAYSRTGLGHNQFLLSVPHEITEFGILSFTQGYRNEEVGGIKFQSAIIALRGVEKAIYDGYFEGYTKWMENGVALGIIVKMRVENDPVVNYIELYVDPNQKMRIYTPMEG